MKDQERNTDYTERLPPEEFTVHLTDPMLYDRLHTLSMEYSVSADALAGIAVKRLLDDVDFVRELRMGHCKG